MVAALAIGVDMFLAWVQRRLTPRALRKGRRPDRPTSVTKLDAALGSNRPIAARIDPL
jgi:hypothetical protein